MVQLAWSLYDSKEKFLSTKNYIIKPNEFVISKDAEQIHNISTERAMKEGVPLKIALSGFLTDMNQSRILISHNMDFDEKIIGAEFLRKDIVHDLFRKTRMCTMKASTDFCQIPGGYYGYKWPKLSELHTKLFGTYFEDAHNAAADVAACAKCFFQLKKLGVIKA